ncbi:retrotransposon hot spot (RHS) protein, partial [Trypanosoma cruzi]
MTEFPLCRETKILLESAYTLKEEGVFLLEHWRDFEGKDTVIPIAKGALDTALLYVRREETRREAEETARRDEEERARREQQIKFTRFHQDRRCSVEGKSS